LIPRQPGELTLPGVEFSFFDPAKKQYVSRSTEPVQISVSEAVAGSTSLPSQTGSATQAVPSLAPNTAAPDLHDIRGLKGPAILSDGQLAGLPFWRIIYYLASIAMIAFLLIVGRDLLGFARNRGAAAKATRDRLRARSFERLQGLGRQALTGLSWQELAGAYEALETAVFDSIDRSYDIGARSLPRSELERILIEEKGLTPVHWDPLKRVLEFSEAVRFAGAASQGMETRARSELENWVKTAQNAAEKLSESAKKS
jgi:hypothetical protein